ncbi:glutamate receptor ionotropic, kainate 2-like isoform X2 [Lineus longissimus]|uniref:glutamate receptor ionotropic, kainate 2-like isoform X2 n=1 Tax=Lineus longissimus TaxID=88925 RepID=UPI002B4C7BC7
MLPKVLSLVLLSVFWLLWKGTSGLAPATVKFGGIGGSAEDNETFKLAVAYVNEYKLIGDTTLEYVSDIAPSIGTFESIQFACKDGGEGIMAYVGPMSSATTKGMHPVAQAHHIPHISPRATNPLLGDKDNFPYLVRLSAPDSVQSQALISLVQYFGWKKVAILSSNSDYGVRIILLNTGANHAEIIMQQANALEMAGAGWAWVVTDGSTGYATLPNAISGAPYLAGMIGTVPSFGNGALLDNFTDYIKTKHGVTKPLTAFVALIVDAVLSFAYAARDFYADSKNWPKLAGNFSCRDTPVTPWAHGKEFLSYVQKVDGDGVAGRIKFNTNVAPETPIFDIVNLKQSGWHKVGNWTQNGGLKMAAPKDIRFQGDRSIVHDYVSDLANRTLNVITIIEAPFVMYTGSEDDVNITDIQPHEIEGYCVDLLKRLSKEIGFKYRLYRVPDENYGTKDASTKQWNGMVKELVDRNADVAAAPFTINLDREKDIDFTNPYLDLGLRIAMKKDAIIEPGAFKFLEPFSWDVYLTIGIMTILVALFVSLLNKLSPYDYHGDFMQRDHDQSQTEDQAALQNRLSKSRRDVNDKPAPKILVPTFTKLLLQMRRREQKETLVFKKERKKALAKMNVANALWLSTASLLQQGGEVYPLSTSARIPTISWWMGIMILVATYTANLAAFLTAGRLTTDINSIEDLGGQKEVLYGTVASSAMYSYFDKSALTFYQDMAKFMVNKKTLWKDTDKALERVRSNGPTKYAFITDSVILDYQAVTKPCNLKSVGRLFNKFGYGFGLQKNSPYNSEISNAILQLKEAGYMEELHETWYKKRGECAVEAEETAGDNVATGTLGVNNMRGVFYIILGGLFLSLVCLVLEWIVFCSLTVDKNDPTKPKSFGQAFRIRMALLSADMREDWLPNVPYNWRRKPQENVARSAEANDVSAENHTTPARSLADKWKIHAPLAKRSTTETVQTTLSKMGSQDTLLLNQSRRQSDAMIVTSQDPCKTKETFPEDNHSEGMNGWGKFSPMSISTLYVDGESIIGMAEHPVGKPKYEMGHGSLVGLSEKSAVGDKILTAGLSGSLIGLSENTSTATAENGKTPGLFARKLRGLKVDPKLSNVDV